MQTRKTTWLATMTTLTLKITKKSLLMKTRSDDSGNQSTIKKSLNPNSLNGTDLSIVAMEQHHMDINLQNKSNLDNEKEDQENEADGENDKNDELQKDDEISFSNNKELPDEQEMS